MSMDQVNQDTDGILIPEFESKGQAMAYVRANAKMLFEHVLEDWCTEDSLWPAQRNFETLSEWFEFILHSLVFDAVETDDNLWQRN